MKTVQSLMSISLGFVFALTILKYFPAQPPKVSYYTLQPTPLEMDTSNLALIGVGLASPKPKPSVMDASPASSAQPVMMATAPKPAQPVMMATAPKPAQPVMMATAPKPAQPVMMVAAAASPATPMMMPFPSA